MVTCSKYENEVHELDIRFHIQYRLSTRCVQFRTRLRDPINGVQCVRYTKIFFDIWYFFQFQKLHKTTENYFNQTDTQLHIVFIC